MNKGNLMSVLNNREREKFRKSSLHRDLAPREQIDTSTCPGLLVVKKGSLRVFLTTESGREITLFTLPEDEICIMSSPCIIGSYPFNIFVEAAGSTTVEIIPKSIIETVKSNNPELSNLLLTLVGEKMGIVLNLIDELLVKKIDARIAGFLLDSGEIVNMTHEDIANHIGSSREVVSRILKQMQKDDLVELRRKTVIIRDLKKLKELIS